MHGALYRHVHRQDSEDQRIPQENTTFLGPTKATHDGGSIDGSKVDGSDAGKGRY